MTVREIQRFECECSRCGYRWETRRSQLPKTCPKCVSHKWNDKQDDKPKKINPLFKNALRPLDPDEYDRLSKSIESEGCHTPLMSWHGYIIAGHNRYQICQETGQSFEVENRDDDFEDETDVLIWILDDALAGRNLDFADKKKYIGELYNLTKQRDSDRAKRFEPSLSDKMSPS